MNQVKALLMVVLIASSTSFGSAGQEANNAKANKEANKSETADNAKNSKSDLTLMKEIRRAVVKDKSLSTDAHNVKIIASGGKVTLKGPVKSEEEKKAVEDKATQAAGAENVTSEITVAASK
jgi:osmotically-inducible protein OsmY